MIRNFITTSVVAIATFAAGGAHADWLMVSAYDFAPYDKTTTYAFAGGRGGYVSGGFSYVRAPVRIPPGKSITSLLCQVLDVSSTSDISVSLSELQSSDDASTFGAATIMSMSTSGTPGHTKISTQTILSSNVVKQWQCGSTCYYYTYYLTVGLPGTSNTNIKSCAIFYQ